MGVHLSHNLQAKIGRSPDTGSHGFCVDKETPGCGLRSRPEDSNGKGDNPIGATE
jgi:hypothetical protein